ncbi:MAG: Omp28-related outer membrane protein [Bacteroidales bacterium]|nr:Omp28-related outer membrane protein [Bacteroidales bacterium]
MMKKLLFVFLVMLGISTLTKAQTPLTVAVDFTVTTVEGEELNLFDILDGGQHVLIDFFFTTCGPCQQSAPHINAAYINFGCNSGDVFFIAIDYGNTDAQCIAFDEQFGVEYPTVSGLEGGGNAVCSSYGITAYPTVILIAPDHSIIEQDIYPIPNPQAVIQPILNAGCQPKDCPTGGEPTIVSTDPENRNVVLEEFTGIHCVYCPSGHKIAHDLMMAHPDDFFPINIHQGSYATPNPGEPDFKSPFGDALAAQTDLVGYPAGTVNRHLFSGMSQGSGTAMSRGNWGTATNMILSEISYVNVGAEATLDVGTSELNVHVEVYYTGDSPEATNFINVALLESNVEGPQTGGATYNPDFVLPNGNYSHQHMLRHLITGQWGEEITTTSTGSFIDLNYTYTIPGTYNGVPVNLANFSLVAFVTETTQEIESGTSAIPVITGLTNENDASVSQVVVSEIVCGNEIAPKVAIENKGNHMLTSLQIDYSINEGAVETYQWSGNLNSLMLETVELPTISFVPEATNTVNVSVAMPNGEEDENPDNNTGSADFLPAVSTTLTINLEFKTDNYGIETSWELLDNEGIVLFSGSGYASNTVYNETFEIEQGICYAFVIYDQYGDGMCCNYGNGYYKLTDSEGTIIKEGGEFGASETSEFNAIITAIGDKQQNSALQIYPNPARDQVNVVSRSTIESVTVVSITGQLLQKIVVNNTFVNINTAALEAGLYFIQIETEAGLSTRRLVIE